MRRLFALAVVVLHGLLLLLLVSGQRLRPDPEREVPSFIGVWITPMPRVPRPVEEPESSDPAVVELPARAPSDEAREPDEIELQPGAASETATTPRVDWMGEAALAARRAAAVPAKREGFGDPPKVLRKACVFHKPSMEWNGPDDQRAGMVGIFPYVRIGTCMISVGFFSCTLDPMPPNTHILDDMKDRDRIRASVPDKEECE